MQVMPRTGKEMGVGDITKAEPNVHGGTKYIRVLFDRYFKDANFDEQNRTLFVFASDNAGPSRIAKLRGEAKDHGLDADKWFNKTRLRMLLPRFLIAKDGTVLDRRQEFSFQGYLLFYYVPFLTDRDRGEAGYPSDYIAGGLRRRFLQLLNPQREVW